MATALRDWLNRQIWRWGWRHGARLPVAAQRAIINGGARIATVRPGQHVQRLAHNLSIAGGRPANRKLVRAAVASHLRNVVESLVLPGWDADDVLSRVRVRGEERLREAFATTGAVVALPHSGNWDLAGAWACTAGLPVTSVAERLEDAEFAAFLKFRTDLGMEIHSHRDPGLIGTLSEAVRRGRVVCLMADRDFTGGGGVPVTWSSPGSEGLGAGPTITVPAGPAMIARLSGAALFPGVCHYTGEPGTGGMVITLGEAVEHRPGPDGLVAMTQQVIDHFAARIAQHPQDWHMSQQFFPTAADASAGLDRRSSSR